MENEQGKNETPMRSIEFRLIAAAGGPSAISRALGNSPASVSEWHRRGQIPARHVIKLCELTNGLFQPHQIRPDIFEANQVIEKSK